MKLLLITPTYPPAVTGNAVTTARLVGALAVRGIAVEVIALDRHSLDYAAARARSFAPDLVHGFHCYRSREAVRAVVVAHPAPYVLTATGTDLNHDLLDADRTDEVLAMLGGCARLVVFHESMRARVTAAAPPLADKTVLIPQAVQLPTSDRDFRSERGLGPDEVVFLLPAGLRPVKNNAFAIPLLTALRSEGLPVRLWLVGPKLDDDYADEVLRAAEATAGVEYLGEVPHADMSALYRAADVVLNASLSEGGMCNAVLEAMSCGQPVLASNIEGNRSVVVDQHTGLFFNDEAQFVARARQLIIDPALRRRLGTAGRERILREFSVEHEVAAHVRLFQAVIGTNPQTNP